MYIFIYFILFWYLDMSIYHYCLVLVPLL